MVRPAPGVEVETLFGDDDVEWFGANRRAKNEPVVLGDGIRKKTRPIKRKPPAPIIRRR
jgi:hypothetical protein